MITSALITQLRREYDDVAKRTRVTFQGDGATNTFNVGKFPVLEKSESINISGGAALTSGGVDYTLDRDSGDLVMATTPADGDELKSDHKFVNWRDQHWLEAINQGIEILNARGFFRQTIRQTFVISAGVRKVDGPSACIDIYEFLTQPTSASFSKPNSNWSYQQDANTIVLGASQNTAISAARSYLRRMQTYGTTSATLDVKDDWLEDLKKYAGSRYWRSRAAKIAQQGAATIDEGHLSFSNVRTMANDLLAEFNEFTRVSKPTRPAKDVDFHRPGGGIA